MKIFFLRLLAVAVLLCIGDLIMKAKLDSMWVGLPYVVAAGIAVVVTVVVRRR